MIFRVFSGCHRSCLYIPELCSDSKLRSWHRFLLAKKARVYRCSSQLLCGGCVWALTPSLKERIEGPRTSSTVQIFRGSGDVCTSNEGGRLKRPCEHHIGMTSVGRPISVVSVAGLVSVQRVTASSRAPPRTAILARIVRVSGTRNETAQVDLDDVKTYSTHDGAPVHRKFSCQVPRVPVT